MFDRTGDATQTRTHGRTESFSHEAMLYAGLDDFVRGAGGFIREGIEGDEAILVVVDAAKIDRLRDDLGDEAVQVRFADMDDIGLNPARIIPAWRDFVNEQTKSGRPFRGIGEPISPKRNASALVECQRHESLLNLAFDGSPAWRLLCPYDVDALPQDVIDEAFRSHPIVQTDDVATTSATYRDLAAIAAPFDIPLPEPTVPAEVLPFDLTSLRDLRTHVGSRAVSLGLEPTKASDLVLAMNEIATNSLRHGGGSGVLRLWTDSGYVICEVKDRGRIDRPMVGRERPLPGQDGGLGVWLANQVCDLVQIRTFIDGSVVRIHMRIA